MFSQASALSYLAQNLMHGRFNLLRFCLCLLCSLQYIESSFSLILCLILSIVSWVASKLILFYFFHKVKTVLQYVWRFVTITPSIWTLCFSILLVCLLGLMKYFFPQRLPFFFCISTKPFYTALAVIKQW